MKFAIFLLVILLVISNKNNDEALGAIIQKDYKSIAFEVLQEKCNFCHAAKKRTDIFTLNNMDSLAFEVNKQVFVKKKMPKGKKTKLSEEESKALKDWLDKTLETD